MSSGQDERVLQVPTVFFGSLPAVRRKVGRVGRIWAAERRAGRSFPDLEMTHLPRNSTLVVGRGADLFEEVSQWRLYWTSILIDEICKELDYVDHRSVSLDVEQHVLRQGWGAVSVSVAHPAPNSIHVVGQRIDALLSHWDTLELAQYQDRRTRPVAFSELIAEHFSDMVTMWFGPSPDSIKEGIRSAARTMQDATVEEIRARVVARMLELSKSEPGLDGQFTAVELSRFVTDDMARALGSGYTSELLRQLYIFAE